MSKFYLENEDQEIIDLQDEKIYCIATDISGMGLGYDSNYIDVGNMFFKNSRKSKQSDFRMDFNFTQPRCFDKLQTVANFITNAQKLFLIYIPDLLQKKEYKRELDLISFEKKDKVDGILTYEAQFKTISLFYTTDKTQFIIERSEGEMRFDFTWPARFNDYSDRIITINNDGHVEASFMIELNGYLEYPSIEIRQNNALINKLNFDLILQKNEQILYSSVDNHLYAEYIKNNASLNLINSFDLENENFFKIPTGLSTFKITSKTGVWNKVYIDVFKYYKAV